MTTPIEVKKFESLYGIDFRNKIKRWDILVEKYTDYSIMKYSYGYINGKIVECNQTISVGKNIGKKNETTHYDQAILDAQSKWNKKKDEGYSEKVIDNKEIEVNKNKISKKDKEVIIYPMLAQDINKHRQKLVFPAYIQQKLDGYRMLFNSSNGSCNSRQGKSFDIIKQTQLYNELKKIQEHVILDGELYVHNGVFENLGILRKKRLSEEDKQNLEMIEYHVYDIVLNDCPFTDRLKILTELINSGNFTKIKLVKTVEVNNEEMMKEYHCNFVKDNYEGSIVRNKRGLYKCKIRSTDLLKYKDFEDDEFEIVDYTCEIDTSKDDLHLIVWVCKTKNGDQFNVRPGGTKLERQNLYKICKEDSKYIGKKLCVKYFELTERGIPRFPTTKTTSVNSYIREIIE